jgi:hypothetical protein
VVGAIAAKCAPPPGVGCRTSDVRLTSHCTRERTRHLQRHRYPRLKAIRHGNRSHQVELARSVVDGTLERCAAARPQSRRLVARLVPSNRYEIAARRDGRRSRNNS